jgi:hypothetical protein
MTYSSGDAPAPHRRAEMEGHVHDRKQDQDRRTKQQFLVRSVIYSNRLRLFSGMLWQIPELRVNLLD